MNIFNMKIMRNRILPPIFTFAYLRSSGGRRALKEFTDLCNVRYPIRTFHLNANQIKKLFYHYLYLRFRYGASMIDYFLYEFYDASDFEVDRYMTERRRVALYRKADQKEYLHICGDKEHFYNHFSEFMQGECIFVNSDSDHEAFLRFVENKKEIIAKPRDGQRGIGVCKLKVTTDAQKEEAWKVCLKDHLLVENLIYGCRELEAFHPQSLNTIRVSTLLDSSGQVHIMAATIRTGVGENYVDNGHSQGVYAAIDVKTGILSTIGYNANGDRFPLHPDTGHVFAGTQIPCWEELRLKVCQAAVKIPQLRYVGWDWALDDNHNWILIEGNEPGGIDVHQHPGFIGLYKPYYDIIMQ